MYGNYGKLLLVDLTLQKLSDYSVPPNYAKKYLGGKGLAARILWDMNPQRVGAFSPENTVIIMTGPLVGHNVMGSGRYLVMTKSPLSKYVAEAYGGGFFPYALKGTGYDGVIIKGKSKIPVFLEMINGAIKLQDASDYWGKGVFEVHDSLEKAYGKKAKTMLIGPAGENLVRFAAIINDKERSAARGGVGAVLGSKLFKGIIARGSEKADLYNKQEFRSINKSFRDGLMNDMKIKDRFGVYGTTTGVTGNHKFGNLPTKNFSKGTYVDHKLIDGIYMEESGLLVGRDTCSACLTYCKRVIEGEHMGEKLTKDGSSLEYETLAAFGSMLLNKEIKLAALANQYCNDYGLDTISTGGAISFAMEASERGIGTKLGNLEWGNEKHILTAINKIAAREDYGNELAEGVMRMAEKIGGEKFAVHAKGLEIAYHEPRGKKGLGLSYAVSPRGGSHMEGFHDTMFMQANANPELGAVEGLSRFSVDNKAKLVINFENARSFTNSLIICAFDVATTGKYQNLGYLSELTGAAVGTDLDIPEMLVYGDRIYNMVRMLAIRDGCTRSDDDLPDRFKYETLHYGEDGDHAITDEEFTHMLKEYYEMRGWDENGIPSKQRLEELEMSEIIV